MRRPLMIALAVALAAGPSPAQKATLTKLGDVEFRGKVEGENDVSGVAAVGDFLVIGSDEAPVAQVHPVVIAHRQHRARRDRSKAF